MNIRFPVGIDSFEKLRGDNFYYVDKTEFIKELLNRGFEACLITRPRRFGKTLTMSMLDVFFDISRDSRAYFAGLHISREKELCKEWMNQWPVVFLSLKNAEGNTFETAYGRLKVLMANLCKQYAFLKESPRVNAADIEIFKKLEYQEANEENLTDALLLFTRMMHAHYGKQVILLIDECDVPLAKASESGYYQEMMDVLRVLLGSVLKTNPHLKFSVLTGCLKIAKESIFSGLNNLVTDTISGERFDESIGFIQNDIDRILSDIGMETRKAEIQKWYDGYRFGRAEVYCPWDVLNFVSALQDDPKTQPESYWGNTSHNGIIYKFISRRDLDVNEKFETLMAGGFIEEHITENLTYDMLRSSEENLWSLLYLTGYLTSTVRETLSRSTEADMVALRIPNESVKTIFKTAIVEWFQDSMKNEDRSELFDALWNGDVKRAQDDLSDLLFSSISYHDYQESFYHTFLAGIFAGAGYIVESNYERGTGRPDVVVKDRRQRRALVFEAKHAKSESELSKKCSEAVHQICEKHYLEGIEKGYRTKRGYGIAFFEKECMLEQVK